MQPASIYVHFPFCRRKCNYCDFYSIVSLNKSPAFFDALFQEIDMQAANPPFSEFTYSTLYVGGGTPSLIPPTFLASLVQRLTGKFDFIKNIEMSFEANPGTILRDRLKAFKEAGFNRLTLGVQSFHNDELNFLTRIHSAGEAIQAIELARAADFDNIGIDLIFGIPGQSLDSWKASLAQAIGILPEHISVYGLTYESGTPLWRLERNGRVDKCSDDLERDMFLLGRRMLTEAGYEHYEISNFALPGYRSRHNSGYWNHNPYLGLGPSAHSFDGAGRRWNVDDLDLYVHRLQAHQSPVQSGEEMTRRLKLEEMLLLGLRRKEGVNLDALLRVAKISSEKLSILINEQIGAVADVAPFAESDDGALLTEYGGRLGLTQAGLLLYDSVCQVLFRVIK